VADPAINLLIIDDEPQNLRLITEYLRDYGFRLAVAEDGKQGLRTAQKIHPDLILLDIRMPGMNGLEVCRRLKSDPQTQDIQVIFLTALSDLQYKLLGLRMGGADFLSKPIDPRELYARIMVHLERLRIHRNLMQRLARHESPAEAVETAAALQRTPDPNDTQPIGTPPPSSRKEEEPPGNATEWLAQVEQVIAFLMEDLAHQPLLDQLARMARTNRATLNSHFRRLFGMSVFGWLDEQRMVRAAILLRQGDSPIQRVGEMIGFSNSAAFSTAFKRRFGVTPRQYRNRDEID